VDARLGIVRVRRMLGVSDAGRIINPGSPTARRTAA
jgi:CO/xanthine dehydrogenase Mo-binding subunit